MSLSAPAHPIHAVALMPSALTYAVLELAERAGEHGIAMGAIVDALEKRGYGIDDIEQEVWRLVGHRNLTPSGFIRRTIRPPAKSGRDAPIRVYEFILVSWSAERDEQLELPLEPR